MQNENQFFLELLEEGSTTISNLLLSHYKELGLSDQEMMLIIHLLYYQGKGNSFPAVTELERRMTLNTEEMMRLLQRLVRQNYIRIDEKKDEVTGILSEVYNLTPLYQKLIHLMIHQYQKQQIEIRQQEKKEEVINIFQTFEQEFGRPLSPMEIEMINTWIDQDHYSIELIHYALKEAVFSNKLSFRYIDKILFEWQRKNLKTVDQIKLHLKKFREKQPTIKNQPFEEKKEYPEFEFYNWLENDES
ncbi:DnaD domain-containing protein [Tepidibacillus fermentans]|uniref:DNA replication protein DnaD n=1 Tax=Tepidibacillus fermentans TaxID=1281767 RepID=A0A4R3KL02_9BACI|nr:DnaD domain-containing protein [Tepidibacillus fermentans]TCS84180.1 DNA replication protein DnaD [Tepidibacillus fermentans]